MPKKVLFADDDRILLSLAKMKLKKHADDFVVLTAGDGLQAIAILQENNISLVVTDLNMPKMDGFALLAYLSQNFPDMPVIILAANSSPASEKVDLARETAGYLEKPFAFEDLGQKIMMSLDKVNETGTAPAVPFEMYLQLIEMEQKTCTIRVFNKSTAQTGDLYFKNGDLLDARIQDSKGVQAAYEIFSWDQAAFSIRNICTLETKRIHDNLKTILGKTMRLNGSELKNNSVSI